jgi:hypothetical protein
MTSYPETLTMKKLIKMRFLSLVPGSLSLYAALIYLNKSYAWVLCGTLQRESLADFSKKKWFLAWLPSIPHL